MLLVWGPSSTTCKWKGKSLWMECGDLSHTLDLASPLGASRSWTWGNGMLRLSLATLEREEEFLVFYRALLPLECSPLSLFVTLFSLQTCACTLAVPRACLRAYNNLWRPKMSRYCVSSPFCSTKRRVWKNNFLKLQEILIMKNYRITLIRRNYATSGRQITLFRLCFLRTNAWEVVTWSKQNSF